MEPVLTTKVNGAMNGYGEEYNHHINQTLVGTFCNDKNDVGAR
jgi:hypothetical protein